MLLAEIVRLETDISKIETEKFREKFHEADRERAILRERKNSHLFGNTLFLKSYSRSSTYRSYTVNRFE